MNAGKIADYDNIIFTLSFAGSLTRNPSDLPATLSARLLSQYEYLGNMVDGVFMSIETGTLRFPDTTDYHKYTLRIPWMPERVVEGTGLITNSEIKLELLDVVVYAQPSGYAMIIGEARWYIDNSLQEVLPGATLFGLGIAPAAIPLLGVPPRITPSAGLLFAPNIPADGSTLNCVRFVAGDPPVGSTSAQGTASASGGWSFQLRDDTEVYDLPVSIAVAQPPSLPTCPFLLSVPSPSGGSTSDLSTTAFFNFSSSTTLIGDFECGRCPDGSNADPPIMLRWWANEVIYETSVSSATALPDLPKDLVKLEDATDDYEAVVQGLPVPTSTNGAGRTCANVEFGETCPCPVVTYNSVAGSTTRNVGRSEIIEVVPSDNSTLEEWLAQTSYAPFSGDHSKLHQKTFLTRSIDGGFCSFPPPPPPPPLTGTGEDPLTTDGWQACCAPPGHTGFFRFETASSQFPGLIGDEGAEYLSRGDTTARYINYCAHPHATLLYWFPPDSNEDDWKVFGAKARSEEYWIPLRQQWGDSVSGVVQNPTGRRIDLHSASLPSPYSGILAAEPLVRIRTSWLGISRFELDTRAPLSEVAAGISSSARWSAEGANLVFTPTGVQVELTQASAEVVFDLADLLVPPYMYPGIAKEIVLQDFPAFLDEVLLESTAGARVLLATAAGTYAFPAVSDDNAYAGTWAQDFLLTTGVDTLPNGISASTTTLPFTLAYGLLPGFTAARLVFKLSGTPGQVDVIPYPAFRVSTGAHVVYREVNGGSIIGEDAPGYRYVYLDVYDLDANAYRPIPLYRPPHEQHRLTDYIAWRNLLYDNKAHDDFAQTWFNSVEGDTASNLARDTYATPWKWNRWMIVNQMREVFPLAVFPQRTRDTATLEFLTPVSFDQRVYDLSTGVKRYVSRASPISLVAIGTVGDLLSPSGVTPPTPWFARQHALSVTNNEAADEVQVDSDAIARGSRWFPYFAVVGEPQVSVGGPLASNRAGTLAAVIDGSLHLAGNSLTPQFREVISVPDGTVDIALSDLTADVYTVAVDAGTVTLYKLNSSQTAWDALRSWSGTLAACEVTYDGHAVVAFQSGSQLSIVVLDAAANIVLEVDSAITASAISVSASYRDIFLATVEGGEVHARKVGGWDHVLGTASRARVERARSEKVVVVFGDAPTSYALIDDGGNVYASGATNLVADNAFYDIAEFSVREGWRLGLLAQIDGMARFVSSDTLESWI